jgi:hypothetical protein
MTTLQTLAIFAASSAPGKRKGINKTNHKEVAKRASEANKKCSTQSF